MVDVRNLRDVHQHFVAFGFTKDVRLWRMGIVVEVMLDGVPACTDLTTKPWVVAAGVEVLNQPFYADGNVATAGGCLASHYLAAWLIARLDGGEAAESALHYVAPVGEKEEYVARAMRNITPYLRDGLAVGV